MSVLLWSENFESYPAGLNTITAPWSNLPPGHEASEISETIYYSGSKSLGVGVGISVLGSGQVQRPAVLDGTLGITLDFFVYLPSPSSVDDPPVSNSPGINLFDTPSNGFLKFSAGGAGSCTCGTFDDPWHSFTLTTNAWHRITWAFTMGVSGSSSVIIDGGAPLTFSGNTETNAATTHVDTFEMNGQFVGHAPPVEIYFDNVSVYSGIFTPSPTPPAPIGCGSMHGQSQIQPIWNTDGDPPYSLRYRVDGTSAWTQINGITSTTFVITGLLPSTEYEWQVAGNGGSFGTSGFCFTDGAQFTFLSCDNGWTVTQPVTQIWGFDHLIGISVTGLIDGIVLPPQVVAPDGSITLPFPASSGQVGLSFLPQLQTPRLDAGSPTVQGRRKAVSALTARVNKSGQPQLGTNQTDGSTTSPQSIAPAWTNMTPAPIQPQQGTQQPAILTYLSPAGQPVTLLQTGEMRTTVNDTWAKPGQLAIQQTLPLPLEVLSVMPELLEGDITEQGFAQEQKPQQHPDNRRQHQGPGAWMLRR